MRLPLFAVSSLVLSLFVATGCAADDDDDTDPTAAEATDPTAAESSPTGTVDDSSSGAEGNPEVGCAFPEEVDSTDGATDPLQETWGAACNTDAECVTLIGDGAECVVRAVVYELPQGYCSKPCLLPDANTRAVLDDPMCSPDGGVACIGVKGTFEYCARLCTDDAQCNRDGYICRQMPLVSVATDPSACLMPDCCGEPQSAPTCDPND